MFDDEKIKFIDSLPERDTIFYIWVRLIVLAGKCNADGYIYLTENIPYTDEILSSVINRPLNTVKLALSTFIKLGMIEEDSRGIYLLNFKKHQNIEGLEKIREQTRKRVAEYRERKKIGHDGGVTLQVTQCNGIDKDKEIDNNIYSQNALKVLSYLNEKTGKRYRVTKYIEARLKDGATVEECKSVIDAKVIDRFFIDNPKHLNPETLFRPSNFDRYLNESLPFKTESRKSNLDCYVCPRCGEQVPHHDKTEEGCVWCDSRIAEVQA
jgi:predicted phage replisome organizer/uncharacterized phage protein (TIGR02220 family)